MHTELKIYTTYIIPFYSSFSDSKYGAKHRTNKQEQTNKKRKLDTDGRSVIRIGVYRVSGAVFDGGSWSVVRVFYNRFLRRVVQYAWTRAVVSPRRRVAVHADLQTIFYSFLFLVYNMCFKKIFFVYS